MSIKYRIEVFPRRSLLRGRQWYFRIRHANGQVVAQSEGYANRGDCEQTARNLKRGLAEAPVIGAIA